MFSFAKWVRFGINQWLLKSSLPFGVLEASAIAQWGANMKWLCGAPSAHVHCLRAWVVQKPTLGRHLFRKGSRRPGGTDRHLLAGLMGHKGPIGPQPYKGFSGGYRTNCSLPRSGWGCSISGWGCPSSAFSSSLLPHTPKASLLPRARGGPKCLKLLRGLNAV